MTNIKVVWKNGDKISDWTEKCARVVESFGLPGNKYVVFVDEDHMLFKFNDAEDALMAKLLIGG